MAIVLHAASGSPYAWRVWLALEQKALPYEIRMRSLKSGELQQPEFLALNPRGLIPVLVDDDFVLYESAAIVEYLDQAYPESGRPLFPRDARGAGTARRIVREADQYVQPPMERIVGQLLYTPAESRDGRVLEAAARELQVELGRWVVGGGEWLAAQEPGAADYALYPMLALLRRLETRFGGFTLMATLSEPLQRWMERVEALPWFDATYPPHWRA